MTSTPKNLTTVPWLIRVCMVVVVVLASPRSADATCGTFARYKTTITQQTSCTGIPFCSSTGIRMDCGGTVCGYSASSISIVYDCATGEYSFTANDSTGPLCPCDPVQAATIAARQDGAIVPGSYNCTEDCSTADANPEVCNGLDAGDATPNSSDEGCGDDEHQCSAGENDRDGAPIRYSSGRVETRPSTLLSLPTPDGIFFGYRIVWGSHVQRGPALARNVNGSSAPEPVIHHSEESTHFLGNGWLDDYSDRLYVHVRNKQIADPPVNGNKITWQHRMGDRPVDRAGIAVLMLAA